MAYDQIPFIQSVLYQSPYSGCPEFSGFEVIPAAPPVPPMPVPGPPGPPGPPGQRGSLWFSGTGPPPTAISTQQNYDLYIDNATGDYYQLFP
jgi:hypothetical protein